MATQTAEWSETIAEAAIGHGEVAVFQPPRLPWHKAVQERFNVDRGAWKVLVEAIFPNARTVDSVVMALSYCKARGLDIFKRPVNIVPMWNSSLGREVETVWPGINEVQTSAARTGSWAGMDEPRWGDDVTRAFKGQKKGKGGWEKAEATVTFPAWCAVTVYRLINGERFAFTEPVYWLEAYSRAGGANSELPTSMWIKRPRGQLHKVAKAASLRAAFPEEGEYTAEEMEGKEIEAGGTVIDHEPANAPPPIPAAMMPPKPSEKPKDGDGELEIWGDEPDEPKNILAPPPVPPRPDTPPLPAAVHPDTAARDPLDIPPELRRTKPPVEATAADIFDGAEWLRNLEGALDGCESLDQLAVVQNSIQAPVRGRALPSDWAKSAQLCYNAYRRITGTT